MEGAKKLSKWLDLHLEETLLIFFLLMITLLAGAQVFMRRVLNSSLVWSEELSRYCFIWSGFLTLSYCIRNDCAIKIDSFTSLLPKFMQRLLRILTSLVCAMLFARLCMTSFYIVAQASRTGQTSPAMGLPISFVYLAALLGFSLALLRTIQMLFIFVTGHARTSGKGE